MIHYLALYHWSKFQKNPTVFGGVMAKKPTRSSLKFNFLLPRKYLKIDNLATTNATPIKLTTIMYLHQTFHLAKNQGIPHRVQEGVNEKASEKEPGNQFFGLISWSFQDYVKNRYEFDLLLFQLLKESDRIWGSYGQKTTQKQPGMVVFAATKTVENS